AARAGGGRAREAALTLSEVRRLVNDFGRGRGRRLAEAKLAEIRASEARLRSMAALLTKLLDCKCPDLQVCGRMIGRASSRPRKASATVRERRAPGTTARRRRPERSTTGSS